MAFNLYVPSRLTCIPQEFNYARLSGFLPNRREVKFRYGRGILGIRASNVGDSYLDMWKKAVDREKKEIEFQRIAENVEEEEVEVGVDLEKKSEEFQKILEVSNEERDRIQRMQVIDRAAAAIAAARAVISSRKSRDDEGEDPGGDKSESDDAVRTPQGTWSKTVYLPRSETSGSITPGPDFWSWVPPQPKSNASISDTNLFPATDPKSNPTSITPVTEKERTLDYISIPFETNLSKTDHVPNLPPFQSLLEIKEVSELNLEKEERDLDILSSAHAAEAVIALEHVDEASSYGVKQDGTKWWKQTGVERRRDGVVCKWTMIRGVSADGAVEWQDKYWEAADELDYKELGSEKSGRDAFGNVWREFWKESMSQERGIMHIEKTADKWGKNGQGDEWQEKWWEHYDASGQAEKWAHKWCSIDPSTQLELGHAHLWHERWGEKYDGRGGSTKYTDKWAERSEGDGWTKWGDKWDEHFDLYGHGVKQGETWWEGKYGEKWNRTWGEGHNGTGWLHKYGKSSSGEHWDTHVQQDTWYERFPHFGFYHCFENSGQLRSVKKPSESES